jgi:Ca2+-binding RTX toxin-like protein
VLDSKKKSGITPADYPGTPGPDIWTGTSLGDTAHGGEGNDTLAGLGGDDFIYGEGGDDLLYGDDGNDLLDGGAGNDTLCVHGYYDLGTPSAGDRYVGGSGTDTLYLFGRDYTNIDLTAVSIAADIERLLITSAGSLRLTRAQLLQFSSIDGVVFVSGSGDFDLTGNRFIRGSLILDSGDDNVNMAGNHPELSQGSVTVFGGGGNDRVIGTEWADSFQGQAGNDTLEGRGGNDALDGGDGDDTLRGGAGDDELWDGAGVDICDGGDGDDIVHLDLATDFTAAEQISGGLGNDALWILGRGTIDFTTFKIADDFERFSAAGAFIVSSAARLNHFTEFEAESVTLTTGGTLAVSGTFKVREVICSDSSTSVDFSQLRDFGGYVKGGAGADTLTGSQYWDGLQGSGGNDVIHGGGGDDELDGGTGSDWVDGGAGDDKLTIAQGDGVVADDRFTGGAGFDLLFVAGPTYGNDYFIVDLTAATIDSDIEAIDGNNMVGARLKSESLAGFTTIDIGVVYLTNGGTLDLSDKTCSVNELHLSDLGNTVRLPDDGIFTVFGGIGDDSIYLGDIGRLLKGGDGADHLYGGADSDSLYGEAGNDVLSGAGAGTVVPNNLSGGLGDDTYLVAAQDFIIEKAGEGSDRVYASVDYVLSAEAEVELLSASDLAAVTALKLTGNEFAQTLVGNAGNNALDGKAGADVMRGGAGNDIYVVDVAGDAVTEAAGQGTDEIRTALASYSLANLANVENLTGTSGSGQTLTGNAGANVLRGGAGEDQLIGGRGDDGYYVGNAGDKVSEALGEGNDRVYAAVDYKLGAGQFIEVLSTDNDGGTAARALTGNEFTNRIIGNAGNNILDSGGGNDRLEGGNGNDRLIGGLGHDEMTGGSGADTFVFLTSRDSEYALRSDGWKVLPDLIADFTSGQDKIDLSAIDAIDGTAGNDAFTFLGTQAFTGHAGELRYEVSGGHAVILADTDGNGGADFILATTVASLASSDFML